MPSFRQYRKDMQKKLEEKQVLNALNTAVRSLERRRGEYAEKAKNALKHGNKAEYTAYVSLLKQVMFNLSQTQDMLINYQIAIELRDMQSLSSRFVKSMNAIMKDVYKISEAINAAASQQLFSKALHQQNVSAKQLQKLLQDNQFEYKCSVDSLSDISDEEVRALLEVEIKKDDYDIDETLSKLEKEFAVPSLEKEAVGIGVDAPAAPTANVNSEQSAPASDGKRSDRPSKEEPQPVEFTYSGSPYVYPSLDLLSDVEGREEIRAYNKQDIEQIIPILEDKFRAFEIEVKTENFTVGAAFSRLECLVVSNTPLSQIARIENDISMALKRKVRLLLPIEGKDLIGVEVENAKRETLPLKELLSQCGNSTGEIELGVGFDLNYQPQFKKLNSLPHLLIGGTTGSGKSIFLHSLIMQMLYRYTPEEVRLVLVDFKRVEIGMYNGVPHLVNGKVVDEYEDAMNVFKCLVDEMERRYQLFLESGVRNIIEYNEKNHAHRLPVVIAVVDEYADIMGSSFEKQFNQLVLRLVQKARASGIHLILATQRPSVNVISGNIKANLPTRISFAVPSHIDSQNILDASGAQDLISKGDMMISFGGKIDRYQSPYVDIKEIERTTKFIIANK